ncbi:MAG: hypothetical protein KC656_12095, partial [Myxococcales bacterium]|nr:hypothetical protein [Myxococcales bacterium]
RERLAGRGATATLAGERVVELHGDTLREGDRSWSLDPSHFRAALAGGLVSVRVAGGAQVVDLESGAVVTVGEGVWADSFGPTCAIGPSGSGLLWTDGHTLTLSALPSGATVHTRRVDGERIVRTAMHPTGSRVAAGATDGTVRVLAWPEGSTAWTARVDGRPLAMRFDGDDLLVSTDGGVHRLDREGRWLRVWNADVRLPVVLEPAGASPGVVEIGSSLWTIGSAMP